MPVLNTYSLASSARERVDVIVIGAGIAGTGAASALTQRGYSVALVDTRAEFPPSFRAEKIGEVQVDLFTKFGLGAAARSAMTVFDGVWVHRFGRIVEKLDTREYAFRYGDLVNALRAALPASVRFIIGNVTELETSAERQVVRFREGGEIEARLLILATGLGDILGRKLGITRTVRSSAHSLALGFDLARAPRDFPFASLVWQSDRPADKMAYLTLFPLAQGMRANLFLYLGIGDARTKRFLADPGRAVHELIPTLEARFGRLESAGTVQARPIDLTTVEGYRRPGVLLIGDAFFTTCPSTGTGMHKALSDVERICSYLPQWLMSPGGLTTAKLAQFYDDPLKRKYDARSMQISLLERSVRMEQGLYWTLRRARRQLVRRAQYAVRRLVPSMGHAAAGNRGRFSQ